jgi:glutaredoxin
MSTARSAALAAFLATAALWGACAHAQVYRIVGPDGKVTFSDRPPPDAKALAAQAVATPSGSSSGSGTGSLPADLRRVSGQYPVTLYTAKECGPCASGRTYLRQRGIPYTEYTVTTREDFAALQRLSGAGNVPFLTIGGQHVPGYSEQEWSQFLDAAGYPGTSQLPASYRNPDPAPLVAVQKAAPVPARTANAQQPGVQPATPSAASDEPAPANPAGIRF